MRLPFSANHEPDDKNIRKSLILASSGMRLEFCSEVFGLIADIELRFKITKGYAAQNTIARR
jgi:hypothetical protein